MNQRFGRFFSVGAGLVLAVLPLGSAAEDRIFAGPIDDSCYESANASASEGRGDGLSEREIDVLYQSALAACSEASGLVASLVGTVNVDYARLGRMLIAGKIDPAKYLATVRDRARKMRIARADPSWVAAFALGDEDGDLVPDDRDACADTPDLQHTDDSGCPNSDLPDAPDDGEVKRAFAALGVLTSPVCDGAPLPTVSSITYTRYNSTATKYMITVDKVENQPPGCVIFYEIRIYLQNCIPSVPVPSHRSINILFRSFEGADASIAGQSQHVFSVRKTNIGQRKKLFTLARYCFKKWRVRTVNGNGLSKGWGPARLRIIPLLTDPILRP